jgi:4-hydroxybenzoate polyprenyltransferase
MTEFDKIRSLWSAQPVQSFALSPDQLQARAGRFQSRIRQRNITEYLAALLVIGVFGWMAWLIPVPLARLGAVLVILATFYVCWKLHTFAGQGIGQPADSVASVLDHHRSELLRQRHALDAVWRWYLAPFVPGAVIFVAGVMFAPELGLPIWASLTSFAFALAIMAGVFGAIFGLNRLVVKRLDAEIAELDRSRAG